VPLTSCQTLIETFSVNTGRRDVRAQAIDRQQAQSEKDPLAQIRHTEHIANGG